MFFQIDKNGSFYIYVPKIQYCRISGVHIYNIVILHIAMLNIEWAFTDMAVYKPIDILSVPVIYNHCRQRKKRMFNTLSIEKGMNYHLFILNALA